MAVPNKKVEEEDDDFMEDEDLVEDASVIASKESSARNAIPQIKQLLMSGQLWQSLQLALEDPPFHPKLSSSLKDEYSLVVLDVLSNLKVADAPVSKLDANQVDKLIKFIFKGMSMSEKVNSAAMLAWHEKVVEVGGLGCIVRCFVDKKSVL